MMRTQRILALTAALAGALVATPIASAQPAAAIGHPLPDGKLSVGTISVRIVAGSPSSPVVGSDVTLLVNGEARVARTDAAGRATFSGLTAGAQVQAKIADADGKDIVSDVFPVPEEGGARVMLSTKPFQGMGGMPSGGAPFAGGAGMPAPRQLSGQPRPERADAPGTYTVRVTYNDVAIENGKMTDKHPPVGTPVALVGYSADDKVSLKVTPVDKDGLVTFTDLDQTGATSYFALTQLPRQPGTDRLIAVPVVLDSQQGARVILSGEKRDDTAAPVDDYGKLSPGDAFPTPAGKVRVTLDGVPTDPKAEVTLVNALTGKPIGVAAPQRGQADPSNVRGSADFDNKTDIPAGTLQVVVMGGPGSAQNPLPGVEVHLVSAADDKPIEGAVATTDASGKATLKVQATAEVKAVLLINGKPMASNPIDLSHNGGLLGAMAQWDDQGKPEAMFDVPLPAGSVLYAETHMSGQLFRSLPFQTVAEAGTRTSIYIYPRVLFHFSLRAFIEDQLLAVQGTWEVTNYAWAPYRSSPDGLMIPLPAGHKGGIIAGDDQAEVAVAAGEGFRIMRPIPPGGRKFRAGFSLPVDNGEVSFSLPLPLGTWQSGIEIRQNPGMTVRLPAGVQGETRTASTGEPWFVIDNITIDRKQSMAMTIVGLPAVPPWKVWAPRIVGLLVCLTLLGAVLLVVLRRPGAAGVPDASARRQTLLDELVELERSGKDGKRKEQVLAELERLWTA